MPLERWNADALCMTQTAPKATPDLALLTLYRPDPPDFHAGIEGFWNAIRLGQTLQRCVPRERWDMDALNDPEGSAGSAYTRFGAFAADVDLHDAAYFRLSRTEAISVDPQTRLLLQVHR